MSVSNRTSPSKTGLVPRHLHRVAALGVVACSLFPPAALPAASEARPGQTMTFEGPRDLLDPETRDRALGELESLGVRSVRVILRWKDVAPAPDSRRRPDFDAADPAAYAWGQYEALLTAISGRGWSATVTLSSPVPLWATAAKTDSVTRPSPREFEAFAEAAGRKFGGEVGTWSIWNEPNLPQFLRPQRGARNAWVAPSLYRQLYLAGRRGLLAAGQSDDRILFGETAPKGGTNRLTPLEFLRRALCLSESYRKASNCSRVITDGVAHHAYTTRQGPSFVPANKDDVTIGVLPRLTRALDRAAKAGAISPNLPIYLTEFGIQSVPDTFSGVSLERQNAYRAISERIAWNTPRVAAFSQYLLRDDKNAGGKYPGFETGLRFADGRAKPALGGFRLPLVIRRMAPNKVDAWGLVRPAHAATTVELQRNHASGYRTVATVSTRSDGSFTRVVTSRGAAAARWRLRWTTPAGRVFVGPAVRAGG